MVGRVSDVLLSLFLSDKVLLNLDTSNSSQMNFTISEVCWSSIGSSNPCDFFEEASVRDLWSKEDLGELRFLTITVAPNGASRMFKLIPKIPSKKKEIQMHKEHASTADSFQEAFLFFFVLVSDLGLN